MICPKCGKENIDGSTFCIKCGINLKEEQANNNNFNNTSINEPGVQSNDMNYQNPQMQQAMNNIQSINNQQVMAQPNQQNINYINNAEILNQSNGNIQNNSNLNYNNVLNTNNKQKKNSLIFIVIGLLVIAIIMFGGYKYFGNKNSKINVIFDDDALIRVKKDDLYGYIDSEGNFVIDPVYKDATRFQGGFAIIKTTAKVNGRDQEVYQLIDKKGNAKAQAKYSTDIEYISEYNIWVINDQLYNSTLKKISSDKVKVKYEKYGYLSWEDVEKKSAGIMNTSGKVTYTYKYQNDEDYFALKPSNIDLTLTERYCVININNEKYGIVNCNTGKLIYDYTKNFISSEDYNIFEISNHSTWETINEIYIQNNKIAYQTNDKNIDLKYLLGCIQIEDKNKNYSNRYSYLDIKTGKISSTRPSSSNQILLDEWEILTGITKKSCSNGYGLVKGDKEILPCEWDNINYFGTSLYQYLTSKNKNYVMANKDDKSYIVNLKNGKIVAEFDTSYIYDREDSTFIYYKNSSKSEIAFYNLITGKELKVEYTNDSFGVNSNYITILDNNKRNYYNINLKLIYSEEV